MRETHLEIIFYAFFAVLLCGFFRLQILEGPHYQEISMTNRIRTIPIPAARGRIFDRNGEPLAENKPILNLLIIPDDFNFEFVGRAAEVLEMEPQKLLHSLEQALRQQRGSEPLLVRKDLTMSMLYRLEELSTLAGGILVEKDSLRYYPEADIPAHVVGYIGKINQQEFAENKHRGWLINDYIGRIGIEKTYNDELMGYPGGRQIEVDARGQQQQVLSEREAVAGRDITLTLDVRFQERVKNLVDQSQNAGVVVMDVNTGEILVLASTPTFDPNVFLDADRLEERMAVLQDPRNPMVNRPITFQYALGSVFKVLVGIAGLEDGVITPQTTFSCNGVYQINDQSRPFHCWKEGGHGLVSFQRAIERSCNIFFYRLGLRLGNEKIAKYARMFGFGETVDLGLPFAKSGLVPDALWKLKQLGERWYPGETMIYAIGQGYLLVTPLQVARLIAAVANGGKLVEPSVVRGRRHSAQPLPVKEKTLATMRRAMLEAVVSDQGTAQLARPAFLEMGGKTGTADSPGKKEPHSWYAGFFPYDHPEIAIVVIVEHGGPGGQTAAVYGGAIADEWSLYQEKKKMATPSRLE